MSFKGYDYMELAEEWGIKAEIELLFADSDDHADALAKYIRGRLYLEEFGEPAEDIIEDCRDFLNALKEEELGHGYRAPLFFGLANIEDDETFMKYFLILLVDLWT